MPAPPLTHHDIIRQAAPLTQSGLKIDLGTSDRAKRYIQFEPESRHSDSITVIHCLEIVDDRRQRFDRVAIHSSGLVSTLTTVGSDLENAITAFRSIPLQHQIRVQCDYVAAYSFSLEPDYRNNHRATEHLRFICAHVAGIEVRIDMSTGGGMPADVRLLVKGQTSNYFRDTLADGLELPLNHRAATNVRRDALSSPTKSIKPELPEDILAILGPQWRPLSYQGDHWKGVLRQLTRLDKRTQRAERFVELALQHLHITLTSPPEYYHQEHSKVRWQVYIRRLRPIMVFLGILALMPISWLFVSSGAMTIHPLALGLTPLLMVGVVVLTAREIPVMEIPAKPTDLPSTAWHAGNHKTFVSQQGI